MMEKEIPKGWVRTNLDTIVVQKKGKKPLRLEPAEFKDSVPYLDIHALERGIYRQYAEKRSSNLMDEDMIAIVWDGARSGWVSKGKFGAIGSTLAALKPINVDINYVFYYLQSNFMLINTNPRGIGIPHVDPTLLWNLSVPLPPLPEQQRIVARLDTLFGQLDRMKTSMERIPQLLKDFRQKVLTQAVTGKLTEEWRLLNQIPENFREVKLIEILIEKPRNGYSPQGVEYVTDVKSLSLGSTTTGRFDASKIKYLDIEPPKKDSYLWLKNGDILIQRSNSLDYVGVSAIFDGKDDDYIYPDLMMKLRVKDRGLIKYIFYQLSSRVLRDYFRDNATGTAGNMPKINQGTVSDAPIILRSEEEQQEIVHRVESLFAKADRIETSYQKLKVKLEQLPQALLAKALRGELVEQLPTDGDARDLLEQIKNAKAGLEKGGKSKRLEKEEPVRMVAEDGARYGKK